MLLQASFDNWLVASCQPAGCTKDPLVAVMEDHIDADGLLLSERVVQTVAIAGGASIAPSSSGVTGGSQAVISGLAEFIIEYEGSAHGPEEDGARCAPLDFCSPSVILEVLKLSVGAADYGDNPAPDQLSLISAATCIADSVRILYEQAAASSNQRQKEYIETTGKAAAAVQEAWMEESKNDLSGAIVSGDSRAIAAALSPLDRELLEEQVMEAIAETPSAPSPAPSQPPANGTIIPFDSANLTSPTATPTSTPVDRDMGPPTLIPTRSPTPAPSEALTPAPTPIPTVAPTPIPTVAMRTVTGRALYTAAISGCTVFEDLNGNRRGEDDDPYTMTANNGSFTLETLDTGSPAPLVVELMEANAANCQDLANLTPPVMLLTAPPNCSIITPVSTLMAALTEGTQCLPPCLLLQSCPVHCSATPYRFLCLMPLWHPQHEASCRGRV